MQYSPIIVCGFNRPERLQKTLHYLTICKNFKKHPVYIYLDGSDKICTNISETRKIAKSWSKKYNAKLIIRSKPFYFSNITYAIDDILEKYPKAIIIEDDICPHPLFLDYMERSLNLYKDNSKVHFISGYTYPVNTTFSSQASFLPCSCTISIWGWGTWSDRWTNYRTKNTISSLAIDPNMLDYHDFLSSYKFSNQHLRAFQKLKNKSKLTPWGNFWIYDGWSESKLVLTPHYPLIWNIGTDSGKHAKRSNVSFDPLVHLPTSIEEYIHTSSNKSWKFPNNTSIDWSFFHKIAYFLRWRKRKNNYKKIYKKTANFF